MSSLVSLFLFRRSAPVWQFLFSSGFRFVGKLSQVRRIVGYGSRALLTSPTVKLRAVSPRFRYARFWPGYACELLENHIGLPQAVAPMRDCYKAEDLAIGRQLSVTWTLITNRRMKLVPIQSCRFDNAQQRVLCRHCPTAHETEPLGHWQWPSQIPQLCCDG